MKNITAFALVLLATSIAGSTSLAQKSAPLEVKVQHVNDRRTKGSFAHLTIELELPKIQSPDVDGSRVLVTSATDDTGRSLVDTEASEPALQPNVRNMVARDPSTPPQPATVTVTLVNPERKATTVKEVRGEIELFMPGKDPNSIAEIARFTSTAGKPLTHKALKANGVEIALLNTAQLEAERKRIGAAKRKELKDIGYEDGTELDEMVKSQTESTLALEESDLLVRVKDPNHRIQDLEYIDGAGEKKNLTTRTEEGLVYFSTWTGKPEADWKLKISMKTPKNTVRYPFSLRDVPLP